MRCEPMINTILEVIEDINSDIFQSCPCEDQHIGLTLRTDTYNIIVDFCGIQVWNWEGSSVPEGEDEDWTKKSLDNEIRQEVSMFLDQLKNISL